MEKRRKAHHSSEPRRKYEQHPLSEPLLVSDLLFPPQSVPPQKELRNAKSFKTCIRIQNSKVSLRPVLKWVSKLC